MSDSKIQREQMCIISISCYFYKITLSSEAKRENPFPTKKTKQKSNLSNVLSRRVTDCLYPYKKFKVTAHDAQKRKNFRNL